MLFSGGHRTLHRSWLLVFPIIFLKTPLHFQYPFPPSDLKSFLLNLPVNQIESNMLCILVWVTKHLLMCVYLCICQFVCLEGGGFCLSASKHFSLCTCECVWNTALENTGQISQMQRFIADLLFSVSLNTILTGLSNAPSQIKLLLIQVCEMALNNSRWLGNTVCSRGGKTDLCHPSRTVKR